MFKNLTTPQKALLLGGAAVFFIVAIAVSGPDPATQTFDAPVVWFGYSCDDGREFFTGSTDGDTMNVYSFDKTLPLSEWVPFNDDEWFIDQACGAQAA